MREKGGIDVCKDANWCLIEFIDWRYSQSCFDPPLWTIVPLTSLWLGGEALGIYIYLLTPVGLHFLGFFWYSIYFIYIWTLDSHGCTFPDSEHIEYIRIK
jgi:hypothetical protein